jgi:hypothetical protein
MGYIQSHYNKQYEYLDILWQKVMDKETTRAENQMLSKGHVATWTSS